MRIPPGKGIAGFVFSSGSRWPADVAQEETFYAEVDRAVGFSTQTILATPLRVEGEVVGVLEFVNREGDPPYKPFTPDEMDQAAHFADAIATLVDAHESAGLIETLFEQSTKATTAGEQSGEGLRQWLRAVQAAPEHRDLLQMAAPCACCQSRPRASRAWFVETCSIASRFTKTRAHTGYSVGFFDLVGPLSTGSFRGGFWRRSKRQVCSRIYGRR